VVYTRLHPEVYIRPHPEVYQAPYTGGVYQAPAQVVYTRPYTRWGIPGHTPGEVYPVMYPPGIPGYIHHLVYPPTTPPWVYRHIHHPTSRTQCQRCMLPWSRGEALGSREVKDVGEAPCFSQKC